MCKDHLITSQQLCFSLPCYQTIRDRGWFGILFQLCIQPHLPSALPNLPTKRTYVCGIVIIRLNLCHCLISIILSRSILPMPLLARTPNSKSHMELAGSWHSIVAPALGRLQAKTLQLWLIVQHHERQSVARSTGNAESQRGGVRLAVFLSIW